MLSDTCRDAQRKGLEGQGSSQGEALVQACTTDSIDGPVGPVVFGKGYWPEAEEGTDWYTEADRTKDDCGQVDFGFSFNSSHDAVTEQPGTLGTSLIIEEGLEAAISLGPHGWCACCLTLGVPCLVSTTKPKHACSAHPEAPSTPSQVSCQLLSLLCFCKCSVRGP